jgi:hypothetical protein
MEQRLNKDKKMNQYLPTLKTIELCLTYRCNVKCANCSNLCTQAPAKGDLTPQQVQEFIEDNKKCGHTWEQITLHGGEPVLNPWIYDIIRILVKYRSETGCKLWLLSNNSNKKIREDITRISLRYDIPLGISDKVGTNKDANGYEIEYIPVNESPTDLNEPYSLGCFQSSSCGVCYNYLGYFPCSPMAAAARVFYYEPIGSSISSLTKEKCEEYFSIHCKHCGFALPNRRRVVEQVNTTTWETKFKMYKYNNTKGIQ